MVLQVMQYKTKYDVTFKKPLKGMAKHYDILISHNHNYIGIKKTDVDKLIIVDINVDKLDIKFIRQAMQDYKGYTLLVSVEKKNMQSRWLVNYLFFKKADEDKEIIIYKKEL